MAASYSAQPRFIAYRRRFVSPLFIARPLHRPAPAGPPPPRSHTDRATLARAATLGFFTWLHTLSIRIRGACLPCIPHPPTLFASLAERHQDVVPPRITLSRCRPHYPRRRRTAHPGAQPPPRLRARHEPLPVPRAQNGRRRPRALRRLHRRVVRRLINHGAMAPFRSETRARLALALFRAASLGADEAAWASPAVAYRPETWFHLIGGNVAAPGMNYARRTTSPGVATISARRAVRRAPSPSPPLRVPPLHRSNGLTARVSSSGTRGFFVPNPLDPGAIYLGHSCKTTRPSSLSHGFRSCPNATV